LHHQTFFQKIKSRKMTDKNFQTSFAFDQSPEEVFQAINNVPGWWSEDFKGSAQNTGDEFEVRFGTVHYSRHKLTEVIPGKRVTWITTDSHLSFLKEQPDEWTGTSISFDITTEGGKTMLHFTHHGLVPEFECFKDCSNGWNHYLKLSLFPMIATGKGQPHREQN
jgi:uncharacterized protein YndB with AHSA1/START domain